MKYWSWLLAKLGASAAIVLIVWQLALRLAGGAPAGLLAGWPRLGSDLSYTFAVFFVCLLACALVWLSLVDQVYRCRRCVRRLRMPQSEGNYSRTLFGHSPFTTYICTYGHGKLSVPDVHLSHSRARLWTGYGSLWEDLMEAEHTTKRR